MEKFILNKKGTSLTNWIFSIILILLLVGTLQESVLSSMNEKYNQSFQTGLNTSALRELHLLRQVTHRELEIAEVQQTAEGLTLLSIWTITRGIYGTIINFIDGTFLNTLLTNILLLPPEVSLTLTLMIWISLVLIIIYIFMKVIP